MKTILQQLKFEIEPCVAVFGNFDGVHKGHQLLIEEATEKAKSLGLKTAVFTFRPHPSYVVRGLEDRDILLTPTEKMSVIESLHVDYYIEFPFTMSTAKMPPEDFIKEIIVNQLHANCVVVGDDFRFGNKRAGNVDMLRLYGKDYGYEVVVFNKLCDRDRAISSTWLREVVKNGDMETYHELTGRFFMVKGIVEHGRAIGRTIGFPTANINTAPSKLLPPNGVYASYTTVNNNKYKSITNVGKKPDSDGKQMVVETYILAFDQMIYGEEIVTELLHYQRPEYKLESLEHLQSLINNDLDQLNAFFTAL